MLKKIKQLLIPPEFRIEVGLWPDDFLEPLQKLIALLENFAQREQRKMDEPDPAFLKITAEAGTGLWRIRKKIEILETEYKTREVKVAKHTVDSTWLTLQQEGVEIQDHTGDPIIGGEDLNIIAFQTTSDLKRKQVIETLRPTIYFKNQKIQSGEVIVGKPEIES
jgi:hypothetical protein